MLGVSYKTAWFLCHAHPRGHAPPKASAPSAARVRCSRATRHSLAARRRTSTSGKPEPKKHAVHALVERGGQMRANHVADVTAKTLRERRSSNGDPSHALHTDDSLANLSHRQRLRGASAPSTHSMDEYVSRTAWRTFRQSIASSRS